MNTYKRILAAVFTLAVLLTAFSVSARADSELTVGEGCIELIKQYEGFSATA